MDRSQIARLRPDKRDSFDPSPATHAGSAKLEKLNTRISKAKTYGLWKMPSLWKSAKSADSHRDLEKSRKKQRDFSTFSTGPTGLSFSNVKTKTPGSESTLRKLIFCLDNGVHLTPNDFHPRFGSAHQRCNAIASQAKLMI